MFQPTISLAYPPFDSSSLPPTSNVTPPTTVQQRSSSSSSNADKAKAQMKLVPAQAKPTVPRPVYPLIEILKQYPDLSQFIEHPQCEVFTKLWCQVQQNIALAKDPDQRPFVQENLSLIAVKLEHCLNVAPAFYSAEEDCEAQTSRITVAMKKLRSQVLSIRKLLYLIEERHILFGQNPMEAIAPLIEALIKANQPRPEITNSSSAASQPPQQLVPPMTSAATAFLQPPQQTTTIAPLAQCLPHSAISSLDLHHHHQQQQLQQHHHQVVRHQEAWLSYPPAMSGNLDIPSVSMQSTGSFSETTPMLPWSWPAASYDTLTILSTSSPMVSSSSATDASLHPSFISFPESSQQHLLDFQDTTAFVHPTAISALGPWSVPNTPSVELKAPLTSYIQSCPSSPRQQWMQLSPPSAPPSQSAAAAELERAHQKQQQQCCEEEADSQQSSGTSTIVESEDNDTEYEPMEGDESTEAGDDDDDDEYTEVVKRSRNRSNGGRGGRGSCRRSSSSSTQRQQPEQQQLSSVRRPRASRQFTRRTATSYDAETTHYLKSVFFNIYSQREKLSKEQRRQVQEHTGLKPRNITYWFSNHKRRFQASLLVFKHTVRESKGLVKTYDDFLQWRRQHGLPDDVSESEAKAISESLPPSSSDEQEA